MPRHGGSTYHRTRKHRKRRGRNRESWMARLGNRNNRS